MMKDKAQSTIEYIMIISLVAAALFAMHVYIKRGIQGRLRSYSDELSAGLAYAPGEVNAVTTITRNIQENTHTYTDDSEPGNKKSITDATANINQTTNRMEETQDLL